MQSPYFNTLIALANGENVQWRDSNGEWCNQSAETTLREIASRRWDPEDYRVKPKTILINGFEVPEPVRTPLKQGQEFWVAFPHAEGSLINWCWDGGDTDIRWLKRGLVHLTEESAKRHCDALLSFTERSNVK